MPAAEADEGFYRICGVKGSGKTHLTKLFILEALKELETNPYAKLVVYEPKREFYAWLCSLDISSDITYFMPSDTRSVALDFAWDYHTDQDSQTLAHAFYPFDPTERNRFWGDALRSIYAGVYIAIKQTLGYADLRLMCLVLEQEEYTRKLLGFDPYLINAKKLVEVHGGTVNETGRNIQMTIHSRVTEMKVIAAHFDRNKRRNGLFSLRDFVREPNGGVLVVSKDADYGLTQDPMNGVLFLRLMQLLDKEQADKRRKVFVVIDEFPTLAGDKPCPGITDMFLRLRSRGVSLLVTYQAHTTLKRIYGDTAAETIGQCTNVIYLRQSDIESANYAAEDLGRERGHEEMTSTSVGASGQANVSQHKQWYDRTIYPATELLNHLRPASPQWGVEGRAKSPHQGPRPWEFTYPPEFIDMRIPKRHRRVPEYLEWGPDAQRIDGLTDAEKERLFAEMYQSD